MSARHGSLCQRVAQTVGFGAAGDGHFPRLGIAPGRDFLGAAQDLLDHLPVNRIRAEGLAAVTVLHQGVQFGQIG